MNKLFANYTYNGKYANSLGDQIQILTFDYLYNSMGVSKDDIVYIDLYDLHKYNGAQVKLPVSMPLINYYENGIAGMFSDKITPIFFGLTLAKDTLTHKEVEYYKRYEPIGCRDERAYNTMIKYGINAYLGGCLTIALPRRKTSNKQDKIFIVDIPDEAKEFIPSDILKDAVWLTHTLYGELEKSPYCMAKDRLKLYSDEAKLVITSLLHASIPCTALGIPVILLKKNVSYRFAWAEALLKIYTPEEYNDVDWFITPPPHYSASGRTKMPITLENHKEIVRRLFVKRMQDEDAAEEINYLHNFYMNRERKPYDVDCFLSIQKFIDETWIDHNRDYKYAIWGLTQISELTVDYIKKHYTHAQLSHVYDLRTGISFREKISISPDNIVNNPDEIIFVTGLGAGKQAKEFFYNLNRSEDSYHIIKFEGIK